MIALSRQPKLRLSAQNEILSRCHIVSRNQKIDETKYSDTRAIEYNGSKKCVKYMNKSGIEIK